MGKRVGWWGEWGEWGNGGAGLGKSGRVRVGEIEWDTKGDTSAEMSEESVSDPPTPFAFPFGVTTGRR